MGNQLNSKASTKLPVVEYDIIKQNNGGTFLGQNDNIADEIISIVILGGLTIIGVFFRTVMGGYLLDCFFGFISDKAKDKVWLIGSSIMLIICVTACPGFIDKYNEDKQIKAVENEQNE